MSYIVKFTPVAHPQDSMTGEPYPECRDAWHDLITSLENDIAERYAEFTLNGDRTADEFAAWKVQDHVMRKALSDAHDLSWDHPGIVPVEFGGDDRESFVYGVVRVGSFADEDWAESFR